MERKNAYMIQVTYSTCFSTGQSCRHLSPEVGWYYAEFQTANLRLLIIFVPHLCSCLLYHKVSLFALGRGCVNICFIDIHKKYCTNRKYVIVETQRWVAILKKNKINQMAVQLQQNFIFFYFFPKNKGMIGFFSSHLNLKMQCVFYIQLLLIHTNCFL